MARPYVSYRKGVAWIAGNDEPSDIDPENIEGYISVGLLADLFGKEPMEVAQAVARYRVKHGETGIDLPTGGCL